MSQYSSNIQYDRASQAAIITHGHSTGAHAVFTVPMASDSYDYYHTVALDLAKHVEARGSNAADPGNPHAENAETATTMALILAHGEGIPVTQLIQTPQNYQQLIDTCSQHAQMAHYELKDKLVDVIRTQAKAITPPPLAQSTESVLTR